MSDEFRKCRYGLPLNLKGKAVKFSFRRFDEGEFLLPARQCAGGQALRAGSSSRAVSSLDNLVRPALFRELAPFELVD